MSEWRPIDTAPMDGTEILLGRAASDDCAEVSTIGWWIPAEPDGADYMGTDAGFVDAMLQRFRPGRTFGNPARMYEAVQPTHWMPIPSPPKQEDKG